MQWRRKDDRSDFSAFSSTAFTLIEILVVIAVIAVLLAIALPALGRARESGRRTACLSNLRGLATSIVAYCNEYKSIPLTEAVTDRSQGVMTLPRLLDEVADDAPIPQRFRCPSDKASDADWSSYVFVPARMIRPLSDDDNYIPTLDNEGLETPKGVWRLMDEGQSSFPLWMDRFRFHRANFRLEEEGLTSSTTGMNGSFVDGSARALQ